MSFHFRYLICGLIFVSFSAHADLPSDADRQVDVALAGYLFSQGIYKKSSGNFVRFSEEPEVSADEPESGSIEFPGGNSGHEKITSWLKSSNHSISIKDVLKP